MAKLVQYIDPPAGWKYGFPCVFDPEPGETTEEFLRRKGYPEDHMHLIKYSRHWTVEVSDGDQD